MHTGLPPFPFHPPHHTSCDRLRFRRAGLVTENSHTSDFIRLGAEGDILGRNGRKFLATEDL